METKTKTDAMIDGKKAKTTDKEKGLLTDEVHLITHMSQYFGFGICIALEKSY
jgi:hypothetical protein